MTGQIHWQTALAMRDEQLRTARRRQRLDAHRQPAGRGDGLSAHERQRALVRASLLITGREDSSPGRRDTIGG